jgi:hypothetical protein
MRPPRGARDAPARRTSNGLSNAEIAEALLQMAIYCGVPDANTAFRIAQQVLGELDAADAGELDATAAGDPDPIEPKKD